MTHLLNVPGFARGFAYCFCLTLASWAMPYSSASSAPHVSSLALRAQEDLDHWLNQLRDGSIAEQLEALTRITELGPEAKPAQKALLETLDSDNLQLSTLAALALGAIGPDASDAIQPIYERIANVPDKSAYREVLLRYGAALSMFGESAMPQLLKGLKSEDRRYFMTCAEALHAMGAEAAPALPRAKELLSEDTAEQTWTGAYLVEAIGPSAAEAVPQLITMLDDDDFHQQVIAIRALTSIGTEAKAAGPKLMEVLETGNLSVRSAAAIALGSIGPVEGIDTAKTLSDLTSNGLDLMRERALLGLAALGPAAGDDAAKLLRKLTDDVEYPNRPFAAFAYAKVSGNFEHGISVLLALSEDESSTLMAIPLLGKLGEDAAPAVPRLAKLLSSSDSDLCIEALSALQEIGEPAKAALPELRKITMHQDAEIAGMARRLERKLSKQ